MVATGKQPFVIILLSVVLPTGTAAVSTSLRFVSGVSRDSERDDVWENWKKKFDKHFAPPEEEYRHLVFRRNRDIIMRHNDLYPHNMTFALGLNQFADLTLEEYLAYNHLVPRGARTRPADNRTLVATSPLHVQLPVAVDWRDQGYVTSVQDQGQCGSCYSFSAVGALEGQHYKKTGMLINLSEQQIVDCSMDQGNNGCNGGLQTFCYDYIYQEPNGLEAEENYPYTAVDGTCKSQADLEVAPLIGYKTLEKSESSLKQAVATVGPIASSIQASLQSFQLYESGVYSDKDCKNHRRNLDHAVLTVGYGVTEDNQEYWLIKNSWGMSWGEDGYVRLARNKDNMCGIATDNSYPLV